MRGARSFEAKRSGDRQQGNEGNGRIIDVGRLAALMTTAHLVGATRVSLQLSELSLTMPRVDGVGKDATSARKSWSSHSAPTSSCQDGATTEAVKMLQRRGLDWTSSGGLDDLQLVQASSLVVSPCSIRPAKSLLSAEARKMSASREITQSFKARIPLHDVVGKVVRISPCFFKGSFASWLCFELVFSAQRFHLWAYTQARRHGFGGDLRVKSETLSAGLPWRARRDGGGLMAALFFGGVALINGSQASRRCWLPVFDGM